MATIGVGPPVARSVVPYEDVGSVTKPWSVTRMSVYSGLFTS